MLAEFSVFPLDKGISLSEYVAPIIKMVVDSGLDHVNTPMSTVVEGEPEDVFKLIRDCHMAMRKVSGRVATRINIDDRVGASGRLEGKLRSVEEKLGMPLKR